MGASASRPDEYAVPLDDAPHSREVTSNLPPTPSQPPSLLGPHDRKRSSLTNLSTTEFKWNFGGHSVYVTGAWDDWVMKAVLSRTTPTDFTAVLPLPLGTFQYKFIVDGIWKHNPALPTQRDQHGNLNNVITVSQRAPEYDSNDPPHDDLLGSPIESYDFSLLPQEDHATEPPTLPRMLASTPLDRFVRSSATTTDFVRLNHLFETNCDRVYGPNEVRTIASEIRHKSKVITTILIAPKNKPSTQPPAPFHPASNHSFPVQSPPPYGAIPPRGESQTLILDALANV